jgi:hypothetical protein
LNASHLDPESSSAALDADSPGGLSALAVTAMIRSSKAFAAKPLMFFWNGFDPLILSTVFAIAWIASSASKDVAKSVVGADCASWAVPPNEQQVAINHVVFLHQSIQVHPDLYIIMGPATASNSLVFHPLNNLVRLLQMMINAGNMETEKPAQISGRLDARCSDFVRSAINPLAGTDSGNRLAR